MSVKPVDKLLPCPFCGSEKVVAGPNDCMSWAVRCECGAKLVERMPCAYTPEQKKDIKKIGSKSGYDLNDMDAMTMFHMLSVSHKWNERAK